VIWFPSSFGSFPFSVIPLERVPRLIESGVREWENVEWRKRGELLPFIYDLHLEGEVCG
jgi:hypothetical protein